MAKTKYEKDLEKESQGPLVRMCESKGLPHTGDKQALVARLVEWEKSQKPEPAAAPEPPATEPEVEPPATEPETPEPED